MSKTVLLARPHPFIVQEMKPLLEQCGYGVRKPDGPGDIDTQARGCDAAVISLALVSDIVVSAEDVTAAIHRVNPRVPLIFASLLPFQRAVSSVSGLLGKLGITAHVIGISSSNSTTLLNSAPSVLYLAKDELSEAAKREQIKQLLRRHIG